MALCVNVEAEAAQNIYAPVFVCVCVYARTRAIRHEGDDNVLRRLPRTHKDYTWKTPTHFEDYPIHRAYSTRLVQIKTYLYFDTAIFARNHGNVLLVKDSFARYMKI